MNDKILELIKRQFNDLINEKIEYNGLKLLITNELQYSSKQKSFIDDNTIFIVVKYMSGSVNFGQKTLPVTFSVLGEKNSINLCQLLLLDYINKYNLQRVENNTINQVYETPSVANNFNDIYEGYRTLFFFTGTFIISDNMFNGKLEYKGEIIETLSSQVSFNASMDTQVFYYTKDFNKSSVLSGLFMISIGTFFNNTTLNNEIREIVMGKTTMNKTFKFKITFGDESMTKDLKLSTFILNENLGEQPIISLTFTE